MSRLFGMEKLLPTARAALAVVGSLPAQSQVAAPPNSGPSPALRPRARSTRKAQARKHDPLDSLLLAGLGTLAVHEVAYLPAGVTVDTPHGHMPTLWGLSGAVAVVVLGHLVIRSLRSRPGARSIQPRVLGSVMGACFVLQEAVELGFAGASVTDFLAQPALWIGLLATPFVAWLLAKLVNDIVEIVATRRLTITRMRGRQPQVSVSGQPGFMPAHMWLRYHLARRGPPRFV